MSKTTLIWDTGISFSVPFFLVVNSSCPSLQATGKTSIPDPTLKSLILPKHVTHQKVPLPCFSVPTLQALYKDHMKCTSQETFPDHSTSEPSLGLPFLGIPTLLLASVYQHRVLLWSQVALSWKSMKILTKHSRC